MRVGRKDLKIVSSCQLVIFRDFYVQFKMVLYYFNFLIFLMGVMLLYISEGSCMFLKVIFPQLGTACLLFSLSFHPSEKPTMGFNSCFSERKKIGRIGINKAS